MKKLLCKARKSLCKAKKRWCTRVLFTAKNTLQMHHKIRHICTPCFRHLVFLWHFTWCFCAISLGVFAVMRQTTLNSPALITRGHYKDWEENQSAFPCWTGRVARSNATPNKHSTTIQTIFDNRSNAFRRVHCPPLCMNAGKQSGLDQVRLTKCQMKGSTGAMLTPKDEWARKERILERFAKYTLIQKGGFSCYLDREDLEEAASCIGDALNRALFNSFKISLPSHLLEDETRNSNTSFSKYLTSTPQTILFGGGNYIVSCLKQYSLARETILLRARFANIPRTECIVF